MPKFRDEFHLPLNESDTFLACREAIAQTGWRVMELAHNRIVCKEVSPQGTSFTWAAQVEVVVAGLQADGTQVTLYGSIFGLGPVQSGHLKGQVGNLRNRIEIIALKSKPST